MPQSIATTSPAPENISIASLTHFPRLLDYRSKRSRRGNGTSDDRARGWGDWDPISSLECEHRSTRSSHRALLTGSGAETAREVGPPAAEAANRPVQHPGSGTSHDRSRGWGSMGPKTVLTSTQAETSSAVLLSDSLGGNAATPGRRRHAHHLLESTAESRLRFVADFGGDGRDIGVATAQKLRSNLHPPFGEIVHRWHADEVGETLRQNRARQAYVLRQFLDRPVARWVCRASETMPCRRKGRADPPATRPVPAEGPPDAGAPPR